jgi:hypothetical protein
MLLVALFLASVPDSSLVSALCPKGATCTLLARHDFGLDVVAGARTNQAAGEEKDCFLEPWALVHTKGDAVKGVEPIVVAHAESQCSYGIVGGDESVSVDEKKALLTHSVNGGSNWQWGQTNTWSLGPKLVHLKTEENGYWKVGPNHIGTVTDRKRGIARTTWYAPRCGHEDDQAPPYAFTRIPLVDATDWRNASVTKPGLLMTSEGGDGYIAFGSTGDRADVRVRIVALSPSELVIDVADEAVKLDAKSWVNQDHLELFLGDAAGNYMTQCYDAESLPKVVQWGLGLADAKWSPGIGKPKTPPKAERLELKTDLGATLRFHVTFEQASPALTVVYSDSDGAKQKRMIATSAVRLKDPLSLGAGPAASK